MHIKHPLPKFDRSLTMGHFGYSNAQILIVLHGRFNGLNGANELMDSLQSLEVI